MTDLASAIGLDVSTDNEAGSREPFRLTRHRPAGEAQTPQIRTLPPDAEPS
jgi:hypothetical protein